MATAFSAPPRYSHCFEEEKLVRERSALIVISFFVVKLEENIYLNVSMAFQSGAENSEVTLFP